MIRCFQYVRFGALLIALVLGAAASVRAEYESISPPEPGFGRAGGYISIGAGGATEMFNGLNSLGDIGVGQAILVGIRGGARINRWSALEASFDYSVRGFQLDTTTSAASIDARSLTGFGNLKLYPFKGRVQPFVFGGVGFLLGLLDCTDPGGTAVNCIAAGLSDQEFVFAGRAGGGFDVYLTKHVALTGEVAYVIPTGIMSDLDYLQYGGYLTFRF